MPRLSVMAKRAFASSGSAFRRSGARSCARWSRGEECDAQRLVRLESNLAQESLVIPQKLGGQDALSIALLKQIARRLRGAPKRVFRVGLLPDGKLCTSFGVSIDILTCRSWSKLLTLVFLAAPCAEHESIFWFRSFALQNRIARWVMRASHTA
jgi:hypothetical protein